MKGAWIWVALGMMACGGSGDHEHTGVPAHTHPDTTEPCTEGEKRCSLTDHRYYDACTADGTWEEDDEWICLSGDCEMVAGEPTCE